MRCAAWLFSPSEPPGSNVAARWSAPVRPMFWPLGACTTRALLVPRSIAVVCVCLTLTEADAPRAVQAAPSAARSKCAPGLAMALRSSRAAHPPHALMLIATFRFNVHPTHKVQCSTETIWKRSTSRVLMILRACSQRSSPHPRRRRLPSPASALQRLDRRNGLSRLCVSPQSRRVRKRPFRRIRPVSCSLPQQAASVQVSSCIARQEGQGRRERQQSEHEQSHACQKAGGGEQAQGQGGRLGLRL